MRRVRSSLLWAQSAAAIRLFGKGCDNHKGETHLPSRFDVYHEVGSREFTLAAKDVNGADVLVHCNVTNRNLHPLEKRGVKKHKHRPGDTSKMAHINFSVILNIVNSGLTVEALCTCKLGLIIVDGVVFYNGTPLGSHFPREGSSYALRELLYQGPLANQRELSESILSLDANLCPLDYHRQEQSFYFDPHYCSWSSCFARFGHTPVHTLTNDFAQTLTNFLRFYHVDDELALFVEQYAYLVQEREKQAWRSVFKDWFMRDKV